MVGTHFLKHAWIIRRRLATPHHTIFSLPHTHISRDHCRVHCIPAGPSATWWYIFLFMHGALMVIIVVPWACVCLTGVRSPASLMMNCHIIHVAFISRFFYFI